MLPTTSRIAPDNARYRASLTGMDLALAFRPEPTQPTAGEAQLLALVLHGVTSVHSRRAYRTGLEAFFAWIRISGAGPGFTKALAQQYRSALLANRLSASTINLRLSPLRKLAREMADNQMLDQALSM